MNSFDINSSGIKVFKPRSNAFFGSLLVLLARAVLSGLTTVLAFNLIFKGLNIQCDFFVMSKLIFATTFAVTLTQVNLILLFVSLLVFFVRLYKFVSTNTELLKNGGKAIANQCYPILSQALNLPQADGFDSVSDYVFSLNQVSGIIAVVMAIVVALIVVVLHSKLLNTIMVAFVYAFVAFFECNVDYGYAIGLMFVYGTCIALDMSGTPNLRFSIVELVYNKFNKTKAFKGNASYVIQSFILCTIVVLSGIFAFGTLYTTKDFEENFSKVYSQDIKIASKDIAIMKYAEYKNYAIADKLSMGQLGYMSYVKQDIKGAVSSLKTSIIKEGKLYFRSFIGQKYTYRYNNWIESTDDDSVFVNALKSNGAKEKKFTFYSGFEKNKLVPANSEYKNYKSAPNKSVDIIAYDYEPVTISDENYNNYVNENYLYIDSNNKKVLDDICAQQGFNKSDSNLNDKIADYMKNNFTYVTEPDGVPYGKDFVNYFLEESKSGNFIHYATAMTLLYRNIGIPARYVSGYALDAKQTWEEKPNVYGEAIVRIKNGNLFSWVEIYDPNKGWQIVDNIPAPSLEELNEEYDEKGDAYKPDTSIENYFRLVDKEKYTPSNIAKAGGRALAKVIMYAFVFAVAILLLSAIVFFAYKYLLYAIADNSKKAYLLMEFTRKRIKSKAVTYRDMEADLYKKYGKERASIIISIAEKCIFAPSATNDDVKELKKLLFR